MTDELARVKRAAATKKRGERGYRAALLAASQAGYDMAAIARAAGITRQGVRDLLLREARNECVCGAKQDEPCQRPTGMHCVRDAERANGQRAERSAAP